MTLNKLRSKKISLLFGMLALGTVSILGLAQGFKSFFPVQLAELNTRMDFFRAGVHETTVGGLHAYYRDGCTGGKSEFPCSCVLLVHGMGDQAMTWRKVLLESDANWLRPVRLYALDLPGFGKSPPPANPSDYRVRTLAKKLGEALGDVQDCPRWMVVGNSFGGWVSAWLAMDWEQRVNKLVLVGSAGMKMTSTEHAGTAFSDSTVESLKEFQRKAYFRPRQLPDAVWKSAVASLKTGNSKAVRAAQIADDDLDTYLPMLRRPTIVFHGAADQIIAREANQEMARLIQGAVYREAPECGHMPQKECPAALVKVLNDMLIFGAM